MPIIGNLGNNLLELDASGRYTHYRSYGSGFTYHLSWQWAPVSEIRFRGNYGTNFRAPNLFEQFLNNQLGFYPGGLDPCNDFGQNLSPGSTVYNNCLAALAPILGNAGALNYFTTGAIPVFMSAVSTTARSPTMTMLRCARSMYFFATRTRSSVVTSLIFAA